MPTYVTLLRYTQKGVENIKDAPSRIDTVKKAMGGVGGKLIGLYLTFGRYDALAIAEFPDDETAARFALAGAAQGYARTETLRAFPEAEFRKLVAGLP